MSLSIKVQGSKITYYGKAGEIEIAAWPSIDGQPARKNACYWDGSNVQLKTTQMLVDEYRVEKIAEARELATTRWIDSSKAVVAIQGNYNVFKNGSYSTIAEVDTAYFSFVDFMDLS